MEGLKMHAKNGWMCKNLANFFNSCLYNLAFLQILMRKPSLDKIDDSGGLNMCGQYAVMPTLVFDKIMLHT